MSKILYYSNIDESSKVLLQMIAKGYETSNLHFVCVDNRIEANGKKFVVLQDNSRVILPDVINRVPALLLMENYNVYFGEDIKRYLIPVSVKTATFSNMEPFAANNMVNRPTQPIQGQGQGQGQGQMQFPQQQLMYGQQGQQQMYGQMQQGQQQMYGQMQFPQQQQQQQWQAQQGQQGQMQGQGQQQMQYAQMMKQAQMPLQQQQPVYPTQLSQQQEYYQQQYQPKYGPPGQMMTSDMGLQEFDGFGGSSTVQSDSFTFLDGSSMTNPFYSLLENSVGTFFQELPSVDESGNKPKGSDQMSIMNQLQQMRANDDLMLGHRQPAHNAMTLPTYKNTQGKKEKQQQQQQVKRVGTSKKRDKKNKEKKQQQPAN